MYESESATEEREQRLEKFYVYRSLHRDESWGAMILCDSTVARLPNIDFGMRVFATNEKEAIGKAKMVYDRIHAYDSDKENMRRFVAASLKYCLRRYETEKIAAEKAVECAVHTLNKYNEHFNQLEKEDNNE